MSSSVLRVCLSGCTLLFLLASCGESPRSTGTQASTQAVSGPDIEVYDLPGGQVITTLPAEAAPSLTGRVSEQLFPLYTLRDTFFEPYLEVFLADGRAGWVYARPDRGEVLVKRDPQLWQAENRIRALLGTNRLREYQSYRKIWANAGQGKTSPLLVQAFRTARSTRDELQQLLVGYPEQPLSAVAWEELLPGFVCQLDEGGHPRWWVDYRQWLTLAQRFGDQEAVSLFGIYCQVYPQDSMEYFFPVWRIAESRSVQHSLLGRGLHTQLLRELVATQDFSSLAGVEAEALYTEVLEDIVRPDNTYWEDQARILAELDTLLYSGNPPLDAALRSQLQAQRRVFAGEGGTAPVVNVRAGQLSD